MSESGTLLGQESPDFTGSKCKILEDKGLEDCSARKDLELLNLTYDRVDTTKI